MHPTPAVLRPAPAAATAVPLESRVVELRQYTLHPGKRDDLIDLFERELIETQEAAGIRVLGQFRDLDDPNRFVWLRGFADMPSRAEALRAFYDGPAWKEHRDAANATMVDSDDVLLLHPVGGTGGTGGLAVAGDRPPLAVGRRAVALVVTTIYLLAPAMEAGFPSFFDETLRPLLEKTGARPIAIFATEHAENNFPRLPVRSDARAFVWLAAFPSSAAYDAHLAALATSSTWKSEVEPALERQLASPPQRLRLEPTRRSLIGNVDFTPAPGLTGFTTAGTGDVHDFDFLEGEWDITNRRLAARGVGSERWDVFPSTSVCRRYLGGLANVDEIDFPTQRWAGMTVRTFDVAKRQWSIYWISGRTGKLDPPVVGGFAGGRGEFYGEDEDGGRPVKVRFLWLRGKDAARWEQAFSFDGRSWETNWVMELCRKGHEGREN